jgi:hypothetical protein
MESAGLTANDQRHAYAIDDQMKKLGCLERYNKELLNGMPPDVEHLSAI